MDDEVFRLGGERVYPIRHAGPDPRFAETLVNSVAALLAAYGYPPVTQVGDWAALESALADYLYDFSKENPE
jgi:hypothetical protein